jgi:hypothetical protein
MMVSQEGKEDCKSSQLLGLRVAEIMGGRKKDLEEED